MKIDHESWPLVLVVAGLLLLFMVFKELQDANHGSLYLRIMACLLLILALLGIALKPQYLKEVSPTKAIVLTDNYDSQILDSLKLKHKNIKIYGYYQQNTEYEHLESIFDLPLLQKDLNHILLLGHGVDPYEINSLAKYSVDFFSTNELSGISEVRFDKTAIENTTTQISGKLEGQEVTKLLLQGPEGKLDSAMVQEGGNSNFHFQITPKLSGNFLYQLKLWHEKELIATESIPIHVLPKRKLKILILNGFPSSETKFLKQYLTEKGHKLVVRNRISTGRFKTQNLNTSVSFGRITKDKLIVFDLLILDKATLDGLNRNELSIIASQVKNEGMGLFVNGLSDNTRRLNKVLFSRFDVEKSSNSEFVVIGKQNVEVSKQKLQIANTDVIVPIYKTDKNEILSAYSQFGLGKISVLLTNNTYQLKLHGEAKEYAAFWANQLKNIVKDSITQDYHQFESDFPIKNEPTKVLFNSSSNEPNWYLGKQKINLEQDIDLPEQWHGKFWPKKVGWNYFHQGDSSLQLPFYVYDSSQWKMLRARDKIIRNKRAFNNLDSVDKNQRHKDYAAINPLWFFLLFLISAGYLWLAPKLS